MKQGFTTNDENETLGVLCSWQWVRSIHLNPVRAKMGRRPEDYVWSRHRAYLGLARSAQVDSEVVLRYVGARRQRESARVRNEHQADAYTPDFHQGATGQWIGRPS